MILVTGGEALEDADTLPRRGFLDIDFLESPGESPIALKMPVLLIGRGAMQRNDPSASPGLSMFEASMVVPCADPAPSTV